MMNETNTQLKVFEKNLTKLSMPELEKLEEKIQFVEQEIVNLKNMHMKAVMTSKAEAQALKAKPKVPSTKGGTVDLKNFGEELDEISLFIQRFADAHVIDQVRIIKDPEATIKQKMDTLDWLARKAEFISTDSISNCLKEFKELYSNDNPKLKNEYINSRNHSMAVINILQLIEHTTKLEPCDDTDYKISLLYSILEPLLINNYNLEKAIDMEIVETIMRSLNQSLRDLSDLALKDPTVKSLIYQKYILRCLTS